MKTLSNIEICYVSGAGNYVMTALNDRSSAYVELFRINAVGFAVLGAGLYANLGTTFDVAHIVNGAVRGATTGAAVSILPIAWDATITILEKSPFNLNQYFT